MPENARAGRIKFQFPPINELVLGVHFSPISELKAQHIGMYWELIRERFGICEQQFPHLQPIEGTPNQLSFPPGVLGEVFPLQRFWFRSEHSPLLIQVQRDAFWLNWRRVPEGEYPHFEAVAENFWEQFEVFCKFVQSIGGTLEAITLCDLTYVNLIGITASESGNPEFGNVFPMIAAIGETGTGGRELVGLNTLATYKLSENLLIDVSARLGRRVETNELALALELRARGTPEGYSFDGSKRWLDAAHDGTYGLFLALTTEKIQSEVWKHR